MSPRTRMSAQDRRDQLLDLGAQLFAELPYEKVHIERVAELAGVSRGLLYYHFPTKGAFLTALVERGAGAMDGATAPDPSLSALDQLDRGIDYYLTYCQQHQHIVRTIHRGAAVADPGVQAALARSNDRQLRHICSAIVPGAEPHPLLELVVRSWLMFLRTACMEWLDHPEIERDDVRRLCADVLVQAVLGLPESTLPHDGLEAALGRRDESTASTG